MSESDQCLWFGDNVRQGVCIVCAPPFRLQRLPLHDDAPKFIVPCKVSGPVTFTLLAVWSKTNQPFRYIRGVVKAVELYGQLIASGPAVLMGDLNSNAMWDNKHPAELNHSALVRVLNAHAMTSAYHRFFSESHGQESRHTYHHRRNPEKPFHIDFCFLPESWVPALQAVEIPDRRYWIQHSDHRPLVVDIEAARIRPWTSAAARDCRVAGPGLR